MLAGVPSPRRLRGGAAVHRGPDRPSRSPDPAGAGPGSCLCDRFADSTRAYQGASGGRARTVGAGAGRRRRDPARPDPDPRSAGRGGLAGPGAREAERRGPDRFEAEALAFQPAPAPSFLAIAAAEPNRCIVDAGREPDAVEAEIWASLRAACPAVPAAGGPPMPLSGRPTIEPGGLAGVPHPREQRAFFGHGRGGGLPDRLRAASTMPG